jgi:hypothetical protein
LALAVKSPIKYPRINEIEFFLLLSNRYFPLIRMIKPRRMRWAGYLARMGEKRNAYRILVGMPE